MKTTDLSVLIFLICICVNVRAESVRSGLQNKPAVCMELSSGRNYTNVFNCDWKTFKKDGVFNDLGLIFGTAANDFVYIHTAPARMDRRSAFMLGGILVTGGVLFAFDQEIHDALVRNKDEDFYKPILKTGEFFEPVGIMAHTNTPYFAALIVGYVTGWDPLFYLSLELLESYGISGFGKNAGNVFVGRRRPAAGYGAYNFKMLDGTSMPSGHSLNLMQVANILARHVDWTPFSVVAYTAATTVCLQRVTSDNHWPSDVFLGAVFGFVISEQVFQLNRERRLNIAPLTFNGGEGLGLNLSFSF